MNKNFLIAGILVTVVLVIGQQNAMASSNFFENLGRDLDNCLNTCMDNYNDGVRDGKLAGVSGSSNNCPSSDSAYCLGWTSGYNIGSNAAGVVEQAQNSDDGEFVQDDN